MIRVFGKITDASGKGVPGAMIELRALKSTAEVLYGSVLPYKCDALGNYDFPLAIGAYDAYAQNDACGDMDYLGSAVVAANTTDGDLHHILVDGGINITPPMLESAMEYTRRAEQAAAEAKTDRVQTGKDVAVTAQNRQISDTKAREAAASAGEAKDARDSIVNDAADVRLKAVQVAENTANVANNTAAVQRNTDQVAQNTQTVSAKAQQVADNTNSVSANTLSVTQMRDEVVAKTSMAQGAADTATQKAASAAEHDASSAANAKIAKDAAAAVQGVLIDGGECDLSSGVYPPPQTVAGKNYSTVWYVKTGGTVSGVAYDAGDVLRYTTAKGGYYFRVDAVDTTTTQINAHATKDGAHQIGGVAGLAEALDDKASVQELNSAVANKATKEELSGAINSHKTELHAHEPQSVGAEPAGTAATLVNQHAQKAGAHPIGSISGLTDELSVLQAKITELESWPKTGTDGGWDWEKHRDGRCELTMDGSYTGKWNASAVVKYTDEIRYNLPFTVSAAKIFTQVADGYVSARSSYCPNATCSDKLISMRLACVTSSSESAGVQYSISVRGRWK